MNLQERINDDIKSALKAKDQAALRALRSLKTAFQLAETAEGRTPGPLSEAEALKVIAKQIKQREDSVAQFRANGRDDLAVTEEEELAVLTRYQPEQLTPEAVEAAVERIIAAEGAKDMKDMGRVMKAAQVELTGQVDGKVLSDTVKKLLAG